MQLKCNKCQKVITIVDDKLPRDKDKAMVKCPGCQQILVFSIPQSLRKPVSQAEKTIITQGPVQPTTGLPRLLNLSDNTEYLLKSGRNIIGRHADISIPDDAYISRRHCLIEVFEKNQETRCILTDDGTISENGEPSTNGTFHNELRLTRYDKVFLSHGDKVRIGHTDFVFKND